MSNDEHMSLLLLSIDNLNLRVQFTDTLCYILVIFGFIGNILGLCVFSTCRRTWHISTVYVYLATSSSIINLLCVIRYALILNSKSQYILRELVGHVWLACKIYEFSFAFRVVSSWITLFWMFERLTCVSPRLRSIFYLWNKSKFKFLIPLMIIILILACVLGPPLYMYQPQIFGNQSINTTTNMINKYCGLHSTASVKWHKYFYDVHLGPNHYTIRCLISELIPAGAIILFNTYIIYYLVQTSRRFNQTNGDKMCKEHKRTTSWMNVVLILHSSLFLLSLLSHIAGHFMSIEAHETWWVLLAILVNCSLNFYVYCLSGKAFRQKIIRFIREVTTQILYKLQILTHQYTYKEEGVIVGCDHLMKIDQPKNDQRSIRIDSSFPISKDETSV